MFMGSEATFKYTGVFMLLSFPIVKYELQLQFLLQRMHISKRYLKLMSHQNILVSLIFFF